MNLPNKSVAEVLFEILLSQAESIRFYENYILELRQGMTKMAKALARHDKAGEYAEGVYQLCKSVGEHSSLFTLMHKN